MTRAFELFRIFVVVMFICCSNLSTTIIVTTLNTEPIVQTKVFLVLFTACTNTGIGLRPSIQRLQVSTPFIGFKVSAISHV